MIPQCAQISALGADLHNGKATAFWRSERIPRSVNVLQKNLLNPETGLFETPKDISQYFMEPQTSKSKEFIIYCASGIIAAVDPFWLYWLGYDNVAVYDTSMSEWAADATLPMECDLETSTREGFRTVPAFG